MRQLSLILERSLEELAPPNGGVFYLGGQMQTTFWAMSILYLTFMLRMEPGDSRYYKEVCFLGFAIFSLILPTYRKHSNTLFIFILIMSINFLIKPMFHQGMVWKSVVGLITAVTFYRMYLSKELLDKSRIKDILSLACIGQAIWIIINYFGYDPVAVFGITRKFQGGSPVLPGKMQVAGSLDNIMVSSAHLALCFPFLLRSKWLVWTPLCLLSAFIGGSATGVLGCCLAILVYLILEEEYVISFLLIMAGGIVLVFYAPDKFLSFEGRIVAWVKSLVIFWEADLKHQLFGMGPGIFKYYVKKSLGIKPYFSHPHNEYISILFQYGIMGIVGLGIIIKNAMRSTDIHFKTSFCVLLLSMCSAFPLHIAATGLIAMIVTVFCIDFEEQVINYIS